MRRLVARWLARLSLAALTTSCIGAPGLESLKPAPRGEFKKVDGAPSGNAWLGKDPLLAQSAGAEKFVMIRVEAGAAGDRVGGTVLIPEASCSLLLARGSESVDDVDIFAYADDGTVLGSDEATDKKATVMVCPPHPARIYVVARIASGHGLVAVGAQLVSVKRAAAVGQAVGARGRPGERTSRLESWPGLEDRIAVHRRKIGGRWEDQRKVALPLDPHTPSRVSGMIEPGRCLDVLVVPSDDVSHLEVSAIDVAGRIVGRAAAIGRERSLIACSAGRAAITVEVRPHVGRGLAAIVLSQSAGGTRPDLDSDVLEVNVGPIGDLGVNRAKHARALNKAGYGRAKKLGSGSVLVGRRRSVDVNLEAGCSRIDIVAGEPLRGIEAWLWDADGALISKGRGGPSATLFACGSGGRARLDIESTDGKGPFAVELRRETDAAKVLSDHPLAASRLLERMRTRGVIRRAGHVRTPRSVKLEPSKLHVETFVVQQGRCIDASLSLGGGGVGAEIRLLDAAKGRELSLSRGTHSTSARACALDTGGPLEVRAELRAAGRPSTGLFATRLLAPSK